MPAMSAITMQVIVRALFGTSIAPADVARVSTELTLILDQLLQGVVTQNIPGWGTATWPPALSTGDSSH